MGRTYWARGHNGHGNFNHSIENMATSITPIQTWQTPSLQRKHRNLYQSTNPTTNMAISIAASIIPRKTQQPQSFQIVQPKSPSPFDSSRGSMNIFNFTVQ